MPGPADIMKFMGMKKRFESNHPRFVSFIQDVISRGVQEDCIIEVSITRPDGTKTCANMKVLASDVEMFNELKNIKP